MAMIKIQGKTKFTGKTIFDAGPTAASTAEAYIAAVEAADGQSLESGVATAYTDFITGLWSDGIWSSLKAACIMAGARTLDGALVPLVGTSPTNNNFVSGDYDRAGLLANGTTKYLNSNRNNDDDTDDNAHMSIYIAESFNTTNRAFIGSFEGTSSSTYLWSLISTNMSFRLRSFSTLASNTGLGSTGFVGMTRSSTTQASYRLNQSTNTVSNSTRASSSSYPHYVFGRNQNGNLTIPSASKLSFYSIGSDIDLAKLDSRLDTLMTDIAAAI